MLKFGSCDYCLSALKGDILRTKHFLQSYTWLTNAYLSDYFTHELWNEVNPRWWSTLRQLPPPEQACLLNSHTWNVQTVWPLSLLAFRAAAHGLALDRSPKDVHKDFPLQLSTKTCSIHSGNKTEQESNICNLHFQVNDEKSTSKKAKICNGQHDSLEHCYRRHVKPKKQHEIIHLSRVVNTAAVHADCSNVVDVGAGQGHLSRLLQFGYGLNVTTVEASGCHAPKAQKYDDEVHKDIVRGHAKKGAKKEFGPIDDSKGSDSDEFRKPTHVVGWIDSNATISDFLHQVKLSRENLTAQEQRETDVITSSGGKSDSIKSCDTDTSEIPDFVLTGLHACGDLTPTMIRLFSNCTKARSLVSVACCYHKLTSNSKSDSQIGYPMSCFLRQENDHTLSWESREIACHFIDQYHDRLLENPLALRSHAYRAALQEIIRDKNPDTEHGSVKLTQKKAHELPFLQYAQRALSRLEIDSSVTAEQLVRAEERIKQYKEVVAFYTLRLILAPVVEKLILLDRVCYLAEQGINSALVPIFHPKLSPRNFVVFAVKDRP